jgi:hypothetical protein
VKTTFNGGFNATVTSITVAAGTGAYFRVGDLVLFPTAAVDRGAGRGRARHQRRHRHPDRHP